MAKSLEVQDVADQHETVRMDTGEESEQAIGLALPGTKVKIR